MTPFFFYLQRIWERAKLATTIDKLGTSCDLASYISILFVVQTIGSYVVTEIEDPFDAST